MNFEEHSCPFCESEFSVEANNGETISYCPFCGSELEAFDDTVDIDDIIDDEE